MRRVALIAWLVVTVFLIVRAIVELFAIDYSDPSSYQHDWGGPSLAGVLLVHCLPGVIAAVIAVIVFRRYRRSRAGAAAEDGGR